MRSKRTRHRASLPEGALQSVFDDSWRSDGQSPELSEPVRASFGAKLHFRVRAAGASRRSIQTHCSGRGKCGPMSDN
jgi:hypothetical protein